MASAPERISIKRRRDEEPVDALVLTHNKKQRTSDHIFIRLHTDKQGSSTSLTPVQGTFRTGNDHDVSRDALGVPVVMTTLHGHEGWDFKQYRTRQASTSTSVQRAHKGGQVNAIKISSLLTQRYPSISEARKFHLTRELIAGLQPRSPSAHKNQLSLRPHLPTFVERSPITEPPVSPAQIKTTASKSEIDQTPVGNTRHDKTEKKGRSIHDDPTTWDLESDELADELAALAFEIDPAAKPAATLSATQKTHVLPCNYDATQDFIFETYIRIRRDTDVDTDMIDVNNLGYLVIDEEDEALWEEYLKDDDDDDDSWDEEDQDSNAEDNPRNDYPEDELSSDDESGRNFYQHRRYASDDEEYDEA